uniref:Uncharacterized protein n=1 Tax=Euplotes crassus TaxID=5936 RepID=A0A7S3K9K4_EUPCR|mmetsp:Transcript_13240/g.13189  ORF Transcript_13240/g.13189 Transcript_13240/m.13189 type:complete len:139 (+) Transcript_13240:486-902(+)
MSLNIFNRLGRKRVIKNKCKELDEPGPEQIALNLNLSDSLIEYIKNNGQGFLQTSRIYKKLARQLITVRNAILQAGQEKQKYYEKTNILQSRAKQDFYAITDLIKMLDDSKHLSPHSLWELPVRDPASDCYEGCELSE